jgi:hypothetical protein
MSKLAFIGLPLLDATATNKLFERAPVQLEMATTTLEQDVEILAQLEAAAVGSGKKKRCWQSVSRRKTADSRLWIATLSEGR